MQAVRAEDRSASIAPSDIRAELNRVLHSAEFARRPQLRRFLKFVVEEELAGRGPQLKEYVLGVGVFGRPADFDPRIDSLVRVEARRLRAVLEGYYAAEGGADPLRIEIQKGGYLPSFVLADEITSALVVPESAPSHDNTWSSAHRLPSKNRLLIFGTIFLVLTLVAGSAFLLSSRRYNPALTERDSIVLAEFTNSTGDAVFDETLKQGLTVELEQSPYLNILSDRHVGQVLKFMGQSPAAHLNENLAREVCIRSGSKVVVAGAISHLGDQYVIGLTTTNCVTGEALVHLQAAAKNKESVLAALDESAVKLREKLGESLSSIQKFDAPIEEATTPSLEALQAYGLGRRMAREKGSPADIPYYKLAIELDPKFAVAYAALGVSYVNLAQPSAGADYIRKAYELCDRVSEREKYRIFAYYYHVVKGDLNKSIETYELWKQSYPRDFAPYINLGLAYTWTGQYDKCAAETQEALKLEPNNVLPYSNLAASYIKLGRPQDAETVLRTATARSLSSKFLYSNLYELAFLRGDTAGMARQLADVRGKSGDEDPLLSLQSDTEAYYGRLKSARDYSQRAVDLARQAHANEAAAGWMVNAALREAEFGNAFIARRNVSESLRLSRGRDVLVLAALTMARTGDTVGATRISQELDRQYPTNTIIRLYWLPTIQAAIELSKHEPKHAIEELQAVSQFELGSPPPIGVASLYPVYLRGEAYLLDGQADAAAREYQKIADHPGLVLNFSLHALAYLKLGEARVVAHDQAGATQACQQFLTLWKEADPDIPVLREAQGRCARLQ
ncbi:MAG: tetratricopeptide repeat protein [Acidobacteriia bacterium]|nr:tetratricopeptide repeat protein [Terriglobia bacterium]